MDNGDHLYDAISNSIHYYVRKTPKQTNAGIGTNFLVYVRAQRNSASELLERIKKFATQPWLLLVVPLLRLFGIDNCRR